MTFFGTQMRNIREDADLKQDDVGRIMNVSQNLISKYETGRAEPSFDFIIKFCKHFDVTPNFMFGFSESPRDTPKTSMLISRNPYADLSADHRATLDAMANIFRQQEAENAPKEA